MGKSRDGKVRKIIDTGGVKTSVRFKSQAQGIRVGMLIDYINFVQRSDPDPKKVTFEQVGQQLAEDFAFTLEQLAKIQKNLKDGAVTNGEDLK